MEKNMKKKVCVYIYMCMCVCVCVCVTESLCFTAKINTL